jgi:hypothetical protein
VGGGSTGRDDTTGSAFLLEPDAAGGISFECDPFVQDCDGPGEKCTWWANDGGPAVNATRCVPIVDDPRQAGESCDPGDFASGLDDCDAGLLCWRTSGDAPVCRPLCTGSWNAPICEDPDLACPISGDGFGLCWPRCDPLEPSACGPTEGCYPWWEYFLCWPHASLDGVGQGDPCESINSCPAGLACLAADLVPDCAANSGCCSTWCDTTAALDPCPLYGEGLRCVPWFRGWAPPGYDDVGVCAQPEVR